MPTILSASEFNNKSYSINSIAGTSFLSFKAMRQDMDLKLSQDYFTESAALKNTWQEMLSTEPFVLRAMVWSRVDSKALDEILTDVPGLKASINGSVDCMALIAHMKSQHYDDEFIFKSFWDYTILPILFMTLDLKLFQVLLKHGADINAHACFDDVHKHALLPEFVNPGGSYSTDDLAEYREKFAEYSPYRKLVESPGMITQQEKVLGYDRDNNVSVINEEKNIVVKLKDHVPLSHFYQDNEAFQEMSNCNLIDASPSRRSEYVSGSNDDLFKSMLNENVYDFRFSHLDNVVEVGITFWSADVVKKSVTTHEMWVKMPLSFEGDNVIESIVFNGKTFASPIDIAMFLTYGHDFYVRLARRGIFDYASKIDDAKIFKYIIDQGYDPYADAALTESTKITFVSMIANNHTSNVKYYLDKVYHSLSGFFESCLTAQFYNTARLFLRRVHEPFDYHALCRAYLDHVERMILTDAKDPLIQDHSAIVVYGQTKPTKAIMAEGRSFDIAPVNFKFLLLACPELVFAFLSFKSKIKEFDKKFKKILEFAVQKRDATLLEVLLSDRVGIHWETCLSDDDMQRFAEACFHFKKLRKPLHRQYPAWPKTAPKEPVVQVDQHQDLASDKKCEEISGHINTVGKKVTQVWQKWTQAYNQLLAKMPDAGKSPYKDILDVLEHADHLQIARSQPKIKGYLDSISYSQWSSWFVCAHSIASLHQRIEHTRQVILKGKVPQSTADKVSESLTRYEKKTTSIDHCIDESGGEFHKAIDSYILGQEAVDQNEKQTVEKVSFKTEKDDTLPASQDGSKKSRYVAMLKSYFNGEYTFLTDDNMHQMINRFLVLLMQIQEQADSLSTAPRFLPTVRNMYIHYGSFFEDKMQAGLMKYIDEVCEVVSSAEVTLSEIKKKVFNFIDAAYKQALNVFNEDPKEDLTSQLKARLCGHYANVEVGKRMMRISCVLEQVDEIIGQNRQLKDLLQHEKVQLMYLALEVGEHLKSPSAHKIYKIFEGMQVAEEKFFVSADLLGLMALRNRLYHVFVDDDFAEISGDNQDLHVKSTMLEVGCLNESDIDILRDLFLRLKTHNARPLAAVSIFATNSQGAQKTYQGSVPERDPVFTK